MDLARQIDIYCERVGAAFWAEPLNALSNLAFIVAGLAVLWRQGRRGGAGLGAEALAVALAACGIVAFFAHTIALLFALRSGVFAVPLVVPVYAASLTTLGAGLLALPRGWRGPSPNWPVAWLTGNAIVVGIGSFLFHTFATPWAGIADTGPILMFILGYFTVAMNRFAGLSWGRASLATLGFLAGMVALSALLRATVGPVIGGSQSYFPALLALLGVGLWLARVRANPAGPVLMRAAGVFAVSLVFRTLDGPLCDWVPVGTHFLWHLFNGLLLWILLACLVEHGRAPAARTAAPRPRAA